MLALKLKPREALRLSAGAAVTRITCFGKHGKIATLRIDRTVQTVAVGESCLAYVGPHVVRIHHLDKSGRETRIGVEMAQCVEASREREDWPRKGA